MSYTKEVTLWCDGDGCNEHETFSRSQVGRARYKAEEGGWDTSRGGPDYCPDCAP